MGVIPFASEVGTRSWESSTHEFQSQTGKPEGFLNAALTDQTSYY